MERKVVVSSKKFILDLLLVLFVACIYIVLMLWGDPAHRGFFCNDESLSFPYIKSSKLFKVSIIIVNGFVPVAILLTEIFAKGRKNQKFTFFRFELPIWVWNAYCTLGVFIFGILCTQLMCNTIKYSAGRLRPSFFSLCAPNVNCSNPINLNVYHENFVCTNNASHIKNVLKDARLSFPSGHSSASMYNMVFFSIYLQSKLTWAGSKLFKHAVQFLAIASSIYIGMTRISIYQHHWSDVLAGFLLGAIIAVLVIKYILNWFAQENAVIETHEEEEKIDPESIKRII